MDGSLGSIQKSITNLYKDFFVKLKIKRNGYFSEQSRWSFLRFPTYPFIGSKYFEKENCKVLFIGLEIGKDEYPENEIASFALRRSSIEEPDTHNKHVYGIAVATIFLLNKLFKDNRWEQICKNKIYTYKKTLELAKKCELAKKLTKKGEEEFNPLSFVAMTNCYKFVTKKSENRINSKDGSCISTDAEWNLLEEEIKILKPKFLVFQSKTFKTDRWLQLLVSEIKQQNKNIKVYISSHPSARNLNSNTWKYLKTFEPQLVNENTESNTRK